MKLWVAEKSFETEDFYLIGIFSSKEKSIQACQEKEYKHNGKQLEFKLTNERDKVFLAHGDMHEYMTWEIEVDKPLESED